MPELDIDADELVDAIRSSSGTPLRFSHHARAQMDARSITEQMVRDIVARVASAPSTHKPDCRRYRDPHTRLVVVVGDGCVLTAGWQTADGMPPAAGDPR